MSQAGHRSTNRKYGAPDGLDAASKGQGSDARRSVSALTIFEPGEGALGKGREGTKFSDVVASYRTNSGNSIDFPTPPVLLAGSVFAFPSEISESDWASTAAARS